MKNRIKMQKTNLNVMMMEVNGGQSKSVAVKWWYGEVVCVFNGGIWWWGVCVMQVDHLKFFIQIWVSRLTVWKS